ncbi:Phage capsid and scaffold protein [Planococcus halocryophilus Or1]|nr:Phage capsid and scaffold protein [Planococcus halocryophilus Or1]
MKDENAKWESKYAGTLLDAKIQLAVAKDANDANDILFFIKKDGLKLAEDGSVEGLGDQLKSLKETKPYLFNASAQQQETPSPGGDQTPPPPAGFTPGAQQRGNNPKDPDPAALALADIERRHGKQKEESQ